MPRIARTMVSVGVLAITCGTHGDERLFRDLDRNGDGFLMRREVDPKNAYLFRRLLSRGDADRDERLTLLEFERALKRAEPPSGDSSPADRADSVPGFDRLDRDDNGRLTVDELPMALRRQVERVLGPNTQSVDLTREQFRRLVQRASNDDGPDGVLRRLANMDRNRDGALSREELPPVFRPHFELADADGNGQLDLAEFRQLVAGGRTLNKR